MSLQSAADVPLLISSPNSSSERRISPSWSIAQLKARLEPITGVPATCQHLSLRVGSQDAVALVAADEEQTRLAAFPLQPYAEITVSASSTFLLHSVGCPILDRSDRLSSRQLPHLSHPGSAMYSLATSLYTVLALSYTLFLPVSIRCLSRIRGCELRSRHDCIDCMPLISFHPPSLSSRPSLA
jgi:hypothetical protein